MKAFIRLEHELLAVESEHRVHAMLELTAPPMTTGRARPPLSLALVIDRSGSMSGRKLEYTKAAAAYLVRRMNPNDRLALIDYDDEVRLLASLAPVDKDAITHVIENIWPGGTTNLSGGWLKGLEEIRRADGDGPRKVLLLTDGLANEGITEPAALTEMAAQAAAGGHATTTIGFGEGFDEFLLTEMAKAGNGSSHYIASPEDAPGVFATEFDDLVRLAAQNVSVEIRPSEEVEVLGVLNEFPATVVEGGLQIQLGDAYADEFRRVVFELQIPHIAALGKAKVADVVLRYVTVGDEVAAHEIALPLHVNLVSADEARGDEGDAEVIEEVLILRSAQAQKEARKLADGGDFDKAQRILRESAAELRKAAPSSARAKELIDEAETLEGHSELASPASWNAASQKSMHYDMDRKHRGRRHNS